MSNTTGLCELRPVIVWDKMPLGSAPLVTTPNCTELANFKATAALGVMPVYPKPPPPPPNAVSPWFWKPTVMPAALGRENTVKLRPNGPVLTGVLNQALPVPPAPGNSCRTPDDNDAE